MTVFNQELSNFIHSNISSSDKILHDIFRYHLGLEKPGSSQGKRIRPLLVLLCAEGSGKNWREALPAAIAVELVHNFSLIHDDIEDYGLTRRGQEAVWVKWGLPVGLNAGDAMFALAFIAIFELNQLSRKELTNQTAQLLASTCIHLTRGQHFDLMFEASNSVSINEYYQMIEGKTAALFSCCTQLGAMIGGVNGHELESYKMFGHTLGMAFQIYDDWLGVWGDPVQTGKSTFSDLMERKKSLPVLYGLSNSERFHSRWNKEQITEVDALEMANWLREDGIELHVREEFFRWQLQSREQISYLNCDDRIRSILFELIEQLSIRNK